MLTVASPRSRGAGLAPRRPGARWRSSACGRGAARGRSGPPWSTTSRRRFPPRTAVRPRASSIGARRARTASLRDARLLEGPRSSASTASPSWTTRRCSRHRGVRRRAAAGVGAPSRRLAPAVVRDPGRDPARPHGGRRRQVQLSRARGLHRPHEAHPPDGPAGEQRSTRLGRAATSRSTSSFSQERLASYGVARSASSRPAGGPQHHAARRRWSRCGDKNVALDSHRASSGASRRSAGCSSALRRRRAALPARPGGRRPRLPEPAALPQLLHLGATRHGNWHRSRAVTLAVQMRAGQKIDEFGDAVDAALAACGRPPARGPDHGAHLGPAAAGARRTSTSS